MSLTQDAEGLKLGNHAPFGAHRSRSWSYRWLGLLPLLLAFVAVGGSTPPASASTPFSITTNPPLTPAFATTTYDYAVRCAGHATTTLSSTGAGTVSIGGKSFTEPVSLKLALTANQAVSVDGDGHAYTIRCLPGDFPSYRSVVDGTPQAHGYLVGLTPTTAKFNAHYVVAFDNHGVPVWWYDNPSDPINAAFYGQDQIGWWLEPPGAGFDEGTYTIRDLNGNVKVAVGNPSAGTGLDLHDFQVLPNGDYLGIQYVNATLDLSSWGLSTTQPILNCQIVELNPQGQLVWSWSTVAHIDVATENANWHSEVPDVIHMNSIQEVGNQIIMSARELDAVYDINMTTGNIIWKLGGTPTPQSLTVVGNTYPQVFSGQHDARRLADGSITVHDNATQETGHASRALRFQIDTATNTATIVEDVTDANHPGPSPCCGSVDKFRLGNWVIYWGASNYVTELTPSGSPVIQINFAPYDTYRVGVVPTSDEALSRGMDARYPPLKL